MAVAPFNAGALAAVQTGNVAPALPASTAANDVALMAVMTNASNAFPAITGWTKVTGSEVTNANESSCLYWRRLTGSGDTPAAFTIASGTALSNSNGLYARIWVYRGCVESGTPYEQYSLLGPTLSTTPQTAAMTTTGANRLAVCICMVDDDNAFSSGMPPATWTEFGGIASSTTGGDHMDETIYKALPTAGTEAAVTFGTQAASDYWVTHTLALIPVEGPNPGSDTGSGADTGSIEATYDRDTAAWLFTQPVLPLSSPSRYRVQSSPSRIRGSSVGILDDDQSWVAVRLRPQWASTVATVNGGSFPSVFGWRDVAASDPRIGIFYSIANDTFDVDTLQSAVFLSPAMPPGMVFAADDPVTLVVAWHSGTTVKMSINGVAFISAVGTLPTLNGKTFELGSNGNSGDVADIAIIWAAFGLGTLSDADAATIHGWGDTDPSWSSFPAASNPSMLWLADSSTYEVATRPALDTGSSADNGLATLPGMSVSGTDTGVASDTAGIETTPTGTESAGSLDAGILAASLAGSDPRTGTDSGTLVYLPSASESGGGTETGNVAVPIAGADSGASVDAGTLVAVLSGTDIGAGTAEVVLIRFSTSDTGVGADSGTTAVPIAGSDSGAGIDAGTLAALYALTDVGTGSEVSVLLVGVANTDTGTAIESATLGSIPKVGTDSGSGVETTLIAALVSNADTGLGVDASTRTATILASDVSSGADVGAIQAQVIGQDASFLPVETPAIASILAAIESGSGVEVVQILSAISSTDAGAGVESGNVPSAGDEQKVGADSGIGVDNAFVVVLLQGVDSATDVESAIVRAVTQATDTGTGSDTGGLVLLLSGIDVGSALEASRIALLASDAASGSEIGTTAIYVVVSDAGTGYDTATFVVFGEHVQDISAVAKHINEHAHVRVSNIDAEPEEGANVVATVRRVR